MMNTARLSTTIRAFAALFSILLVSSTFAQSGEDMLSKLSDEDKESMKALVIYPEETRNAIFVATQQPAALIKMEKIQKRTAESFNTIIETKDKDTQRALWDLTRYPGLTEDIASVGPNNEPKLMDVLKSHPEIIRARALQMYDQQYTAVSKIVSLKGDGEGAFKKLMKDYSPETKDAMQHLIEKPEVLSILTENMDLTVTVGDMYRQDPAGTLVLAEKMNGEVAEENAKELNDWRERLENDPEAKAEYEKASEEFTNEYVDDDVYYDEQESSENSSSVNDVNRDPQSDYDNGSQGAQEVHHYYHYSYPYWFSYPRWYGYSVWRPYPARFHTWGVGFGWGNPRPYWNNWYGWGWGMPSGYFMNWYYGYPHNYYRYPNLACQYSAHYYGHRNSVSTISTHAGRWQRENRDVLPARLDPKRPNSVQAVRDLGKLETARTEYNRENPSAQLSRTNYLDRTKKEYPTLANNRPASNSSSARENVSSNTLPAVESGQNVRGNTSGTARPTSSPRPSGTNTTSTRPSKTTTRPAQNTSTRPSNPSTPQQTKPVKRPSSTQNKSPRTNQSTKVVRSKPSSSSSKSRVNTSKSRSSGTKSSSARSGSSRSSSQSARSSSSSKSGSSAVKRR